MVCSANLAKYLFYLYSCYLCSCLLRSHTAQPKIPIDDLPTYHETDNFLVKIFSYC